MSCMTMSYRSMVRPILCMLRGDVDMSITCRRDAASSTTRALLSWRASLSLHLVVIAKKHVDWRTRAPVKKFFHGVQVL